MPPFKQFKILRHDPNFQIPVPVVATPVLNSPVYVAKDLYDEGVEGTVINIDYNELSTWEAIPTEDRADLCPVSYQFYELFPHLALTVEITNLAIIINNKKYILEEHVKRFIDNYKKGFLVNPISFVLVRKKHLTV